ncbi:uncharacterized protein C8A04DRAFT_25698 [Dichotomopilus funicola]|uniref:DUF6546 domain-containing protein n=1 Tax=Dichotomopilus funicola TaxID=1934379 RepID=A0AAN6V805_9PEZI|nr:hypothetical protein C8A04DRAFT_25698 [Dichotomopilus funicola]
MYFAFDTLNTWQPGKDVSLSISLRATKSSPYHVVGFCKAVYKAPRQPPASNPGAPPNPWFERVRRGPTRWLKSCEMPDMTFPQVPAVTDLELCRTKGVWWTGVAVQRLLYLLPRIRALRCGAMSHWSEQLTGTIIQQLGAFPADISKLVLFGDYSDGTFFRLLKESCGGQVKNLPPRPTPTYATGRALARIGSAFPKLKHLSASFVVEGADVLRVMFELCTPPYATLVTHSWKTLVSLTLTSGTLIPGRRNYAKISSLLRNAAATATALPALQRLEVWNGAESTACAFRYLGASLTGGPKRVAHLSW